MTERSGKQKTDSRHIQGIAYATRGGLLSLAGRLARRLTLIKPHREPRPGSVGVSAPVAVCIGSVAAITLFLLLDAVRVRWANNMLAHDDSKIGAVYTVSIALELSAAGIAALFSSVIHHNRRWLLLALSVTLVYSALRGSFVRPPPFWLGWLPPDAPPSALSFMGTRIIEWVTRSAFSAIAVLPASFAAVRLRNHFGMVRSQSENRGARLVAGCIIFGVAWYVFLGILYWLGSPRPARFSLDLRDAERIVLGGCGNGDDLRPSTSVGIASRIVEIDGACAPEQPPPVIRLECYDGATIYDVSSLRTGGDDLWRVTFPSEGVYWPRRDNVRLEVRDIRPEAKCGRQWFIGPRLPKADGLRVIYEIPCGVPVAITLTPVTQRGEYRPAGGAYSPLLFLLTEGGMPLWEWHLVGGSQTLEYKLGPERKRVREVSINDTSWTSGKGSRWSTLLEQPDGLVLISRSAMGGEGYWVHMSPLPSRGPAELFPVQPLVARDFVIVVNSGAASFDQKEPRLPSHKDLPGDVFQLRARLLWSERQRSPIWKIESDGKQWLEAHCPRGCITTNGAERSLGPTDDLAAHGGFDAQYTLADTGFGLCARGWADTITANYEQVLPSRWQGIDPAVRGALATAVFSWVGVAIALIWRRRNVASSEPASQIESSARAKYDSTPQKSQGTMDLRRNEERAALARSTRRKDGGKPQNKIGPSNMDEES